MSQRVQRKQADWPHPVPLWYWIVLAGIALIGTALITYSVIHRVSVVGVTTEGDYFQGNPDAPMTIIDWGNFG